MVPLVEENVELFRIYCPPDPNMVQARPGLCMIAMVRQAAGGGVLVAMPTALVPAGSLRVDPREGDVVGPHVQLEVPTVRMSNAGMDHIGVDISLYVVDLGQEALQAITPLSLVPESEDQGLIGFGEDLDVIPDPYVLVDGIKSWISRQVNGLPSTPRKKEKSIWRSLWWRHRSPPGRN